MKRFIKNIVVLTLSIPTLLLMFAAMVWSIIINIFSVIIGDFKPYKWLNKLNDLFYLMERKIVH